VVAAALLTVGIIIRRKRMRQIVLTQEHYLGYVGKTLFKAYKCTSVCRNIEMGMQSD